MINMLTGLV